MSEWVVNSLANVPAFLGYFGATILLLLIFMAVYTAITPHREFALIRQGNVAAMLSLAGAWVGFVLPLASVVTHSVSIPDLVVWGAIAMLVQIVAYFVTRVAVPTLSADITAGKNAVGGLSGTVALSVGILNAACMTY
ncbi:MAG: DUF350 domain-containing protein [Alphaproteobacteria bacterium]